MADEPTEQFPTHTDIPVFGRGSSPIQEIEYEENMLPSNEEIERLSQSLVNYASKHQLSLRNVRSIIKQLLTNESLIIFAQQLAGDITDEPLNSSGSKTGSKLTRSRRKERVRERDKYGDKYGGGTALLDISFSEQDTSSDEEYNPFIDVTKNEGLRDRNEPQDDVSSPSSLSSPSPEPAFSDIDSLISAPKEVYTPTTSIEQTGLPTSSIEQTAFPTSSQAKCTCSNTEETKSYSTRSRDNLKQKSLLELEACLVAPDLTPESPEEISNGGDSDAWRNWLASICQAESSERSGSDSDDADYNFLQDIDREINLMEKKEEYRYDFQVRVSQREILELVNSLVEEAGPWGGIPDANEGFVSENEYSYRAELGSESDNKLTFEVLESRVALTPEQKVSYQECMGRLQVQLHQHIQILFQTYMLSLYDPQLKDVNTYTKRLIQDFYTNISTSAQIAPIPGLENAMQLVYSPPQIEWQHKRTKLIPSSAINLMREYTVFWSFPKLLPHQQLMPLKRSREDEQKGRKFVLAEDCLLAFGLSVFGLVDGLMKICKYVLPTKTPKQIISRIRNLCSSRYETNVVKHWKQTNELKIPWKELEESHPDTIPLWAQQCVDEFQNTLKSQTKRNSKAIKKAIELSPSFVNRMLLECDSIGKNLSQCHRLAIMNIIFDIEKYQTSALDRNTFYRRLASGLWCFVTTALRKDEQTYYELIKTIEDNADGNLNILVERLSIVLKYHPALLFLFLKFLKTPTQQKEDQRRAFLKAKSFIDMIREKFKSNPEKALRVFTTIDNLSKDKLPNQELEGIIRDNLANFEGSDQIFNEYITESCELSSASEGEFEEIFFVENSTDHQDVNKYEFEEIYFDLPTNSTNRDMESYIKIAGNKRKIIKTTDSAKTVSRKNTVAKKQKGEVKSNKRKNLKTYCNKK